MVRVGALPNSMPGAGLTTTVMPSASCVVGGGTTETCPASAMPSSTNRSRTLDEVVWMACGRPSTTRVMCF